MAGGAALGGASANARAGAHRPLDAERLCSASGPINDDVDWNAVADTTDTQLIWQLAPTVSRNVSPTRQIGPQPAARFAPARCACALNTCSTGAAERATRASSRRLWSHPNGRSCDDRFGGTDPPRRPPPQAQGGS